MKKETILVVDDEEDILELVRYNLSREGYGVQCAASGEEARGIITAGNVDLLILDLMLPGMDGLELARRLKGGPDHAELPIIMLSARGEEADIVAGLQAMASSARTTTQPPQMINVSSNSPRCLRSRNSPAVGRSVMSQLVWMCLFRSL